MVARRPRQYLKTLSSLSRVNLLHELQVHGSMTVAELAATTGLHHNTAREHLHRLIDAGFVHSEPIPRSTKGRPMVLYRAATHPDDTERVARRDAAGARAEQFHRMMPLREVGTEPTGLVDRQFDMLDDHMNQCGSDAQLDRDASHMTMHNCPFSSLARENPQVCKVHFALVKDALELEAGPLTARAVHPFSGPNTCIVDLDNAATPAT
ncbi:MAG: helix-turn-helix domain-containing protein [Pseudolysinimonas sp.]